MHALVVAGGILFLLVVLGISRESSASISKSHHNESDNLSSRVTETLALPGQAPTKPAAFITETPKAAAPVSETAATTALIQPPAQQNRDALDDIDWVRAEVQKGDSPSSIFSRHNIHSDLYKLIESDVAKDTLKRIRPGQTVQLDINENGLQTLLYEPSTTERLLVKRSSDGGFDVSLSEREIEIRQVHTNGVIEDSLFASASRAGVSDNLIMKLADIFAYDVDFALDIREGDQFRMIYEERYLDGEKLGPGEILAAEFVNQGNRFQAVRYTDKDGSSGYYTPEGRNMRKAFLRTPVNFSRISSHFNLKRKHPILHTIKAHKGTDYAAPTGTPIKAAGNGKIIFRGVKGGYGNVVILRHGQTYSTLYGHMSRFAKGQSVGTNVQQGEIIGYVGSTGRSTGPHLHYEFRVNGVHQNPLTVALPKADPLPANLMNDFAVTAQPLLAWLGQIDRLAALNTNP
jgi:murein DD-endopeptidase MepM/ murein hydrolase activator NlpD